MTVAEGLVEENNMTTNLVPRGALAALAAALAIAATTVPASAFTLSAPSLAAPVAAGGVEHVWWDRWGRWHPNWGWGPRYYGYYHPVRRCWVGAWGGVHCRWY